MVPIIWEGEELFDFLINSLLFNGTHTKEYTNNLSAGDLHDVGVDSITRNYTSLTLYQSMYVAGTRAQTYFYVAGDGMFAE